MDREYLPEPIAGYLKLDVTAVKTFSTEWNAAYPLTTVDSNQWVLLICAEGAALRWRDSPGTLDSSTGVPMANGEKFLYTGSSPGSLRFLGAGATCHICVWKMR